LLLLLTQFLLRFLASKGAMPVVGVCIRVADVLITLLGGLMEAKTRGSTLKCILAHCFWLPFIHREDAERAIRALEGFGYDNLILHVEWAAPRAER
jgi:hypothetical protein